MDKIIVTSVGTVFIAGIYWFFFGKKDTVSEANGNIDILVDGGYKPNVIKIRKNQPVTLTFLRKDSNDCLEEVIFPDYKIKEFLPLNKPVSVTLSPPHPKHSTFHCGMNMFHGKIEVV